MGLVQINFSGLLASANQVNYRENSVLVDSFNASIRLFKRFQELKLAGDNELARMKAIEAGTSLYQCCEWTFKNYLFRRYIELVADGNMTMTERVEKTNALDSKRTRLSDLIASFKTYASPSYLSFEIDTDILLNNSQNVNNDPKHSARIPDPNKMRESIGELRKIIRNYIDSNAQLDLIEDSIYGDGNGWYQILDDTCDFSESYAYVLVTKRMPSVDLQGLFSKKWDLIIDFDPASDVDGLAKEYESITKITPWKHLLNQVEAKKKFTFSGKTQWVMANGVADVPESIGPTNKWISLYGRHLSTMLEEFHKVYAKPVKIFIYPVDYEKNLERVVQAFNDIYNDGADADFYVLSSKTEYSKIDSDNFNVVGLSIEQFCKNLNILNSDKIIADKPYGRKFPSTKADDAIIEDGFFVELQDSFEVLYAGIEAEEEEDAVATSRRNFYCGNNDISWYGIKERFDVIRNETEIVKGKIVNDLSERKGRLLTKVCYEPGMGGTTMLRRLAKELSNRYPTLILKKINDHTTRNVQKIYDLTGMPILIFADSNKIEFEDAKKLHFDLKTMGFGFVICFFERKSRGKETSSDGAVYTVVGQLSDGEAREMALKLQDYAISEAAKSKIDAIVKNPNSSERSPFIMSMYAFDSEFKGVKPYISRFLREMNPQAKKIVFALSLADYGNVSLDVQYFSDLYGKDSNNFLINQMPEIRDLVKIEKDNGKYLIKIKYHLFGEEILKQLSLGETATEISFTALVDNILAFIEDSKSYIVNQSVLNALRSLFITRVADTDSEKPAFSPLIQRLKEETSVVNQTKYDDSNDAIIRIFNKLVETYPEEPHFTAHLARYYFYIDRNYDKGFSNIDAAIEMSESLTGYVDPFLYHMKGMGYSSRITNEYIKEIYTNEREGRPEENQAIIELIEEDAEKAFALFKLVREGNTGVAGHVSEINLCIQVATMARNMLEESEESFCQYLSTENGVWAMKYVDRAADLWEECKKLALESNVDDLDGIEARLNSLTLNLDDSIDLWERYIDNSEGKNRIQARRILARAYEKRRHKASASEKQKYLQKIVSLMEQNMVEESQHSGNIRIWFDAIMKLEYENQDALIQDAILKLNHWVALTDSVEAHYYRFVLKFLQAVEDSASAQTDLPKLLRELKGKSYNIFNRTAVQHWLTSEGKGLGSLMVNSRSKKDALSEDEMASKMLLLTGRISNNYVNDSHAYITYRGVEVYFNPSATKGEVDKSKINQRVKFGVGFSYDGPRAYNTSIKIIDGSAETVEIKNLEAGKIVKCEVLKNVAHFTQVRIMGYQDERGSIHINDLSGAYSAENRPQNGEILEAVVLYESFDNKIQRKVWRLSTNLSGQTNDSESESQMSVALKKAGFVRGREDV
ncbi:hypothetical protein SAMN02910339_02457 [Lachnospiraceae bacterium YSD2013]|nr:hypothetical protein SAMN02910339_02457 [Lachnospiraceae bacterium YSD2013]